MNRCYCLLLSVWIGCVAVCPAADFAETDDAVRVRSGLLALYDFQAVEGEIVEDRSGLGEGTTTLLRHVRPIASTSKS